MSAVPFRHVLSQRAMIAALGRAAWRELRRPPGALAAAPGRWFEARVRPPPRALVNAYVRDVGGDPAWYRDTLPAHMFPQWALPVGARALAELPYPLARVVNAGCRIEVHAPLPAGEPLEVRARIEEVDEDGRRAIVTQTIVTGTPAEPDALVATLRAFVPLAAARGEARQARRRRPASLVPAEGVREIAFVRIGAHAGLDFAKLTGDFNPIHWLGPYARARGFKACILHGFATLARALESLNRSRFSGDSSRLRWLDANFTRPLVLPATVGVYVGELGRIWVGDAPGGHAFLEGQFGAG